MTDCSLNFWHFQNTWLMQECDAMSISIASVSILLIPTKSYQVTMYLQEQYFHDAVFGFSSEFLIVLSYMHLGVPNLWSSWTAFEINMKQSSLLTKLGCLPKVGINEHILRSYLLCYYSKKFHKCTIAKSRTWSNIWCQGSDPMELKWPSYVILWKSIIGKIK